MVGIYLYGIVESPFKIGLDVDGIDTGNPARIVAGDGLGCVVSDYRGGAFTDLSREQLVRRLLAHQWVVERVMEEHTVLPVKFGTLLDSAQEVLDLFSQGRSRLAYALAAIRDKVEIEVAATWDTSRVLRAIGDEADVVRAKEAIARMGEPTREDLVRVGQLAKAHMDRRREGYRERMVSLLRPFCVDMAYNALVADELVMNTAFLVDWAQQSEFDAAVQRLDTLFQDEISFRIVGPLPPYTFSTVEVTRLTLEMVERARRALRLGDVISEEEVKRAYRRLAAGEQGNQTQGDGPGHEVAASLKEASEVLLRYCRAREEAARSERPSGPDEDVPRCLFDISIRKSCSAEVDLARFGGAARV